MTVKHIGFLIVFSTSLYCMQERFMEPEVAQAHEPIVEQSAAPAVEEQSAPQEIAVQAPQERSPEQQKAIKTLASFLTSKRLIKKLQGFFMRSVKPSKQLLRSFFFYCDFHKDQLVQLKECFNDYAQLLEQAIPVYARAGSHLLASPQLKEIVDSLHIDESECCDNEPRFLDIEQLMEENPALYAQIQEINNRFEQYNEKWAPFFTTIAPYIEARVKLHENELQSSLESFFISLILRNLGQGLGLGIEGYMKVRTLDLCDGQVMIDLVKEIHQSAVANKTELEETLVSSAQEIVAAYREMFVDELQRAMKRTR